MASPDPRFTAAIPTATVQSAVNTTLALKIVVGRFGQMTQRISEIISRKTFRLPLRLITTGLPWPHDGCPAHPVVGGAGGLGGRGGVRALAGSGSIPRVSRSATRVASARRFFSTILEVLLHRRSNRSKHGGRVRRLQSTQIRIRQPKRWAPSTVLEPAIEHTRPGAEQRARTTTVALQASAQNGTYACARVWKAGSASGDAGYAANRQRGGSRTLVLRECFGEHRPVNLGSGPFSRRATHANPCAAQQNADISVQWDSALAATKERPTRDQRL
jgi:hypothetical protein